MAAAVHICLTRTLSFLVVEPADEHHARRDHERAEPKPSAYLHVVELWDVSDADENRVTSVLELHLNAHFCVAHHQAGIWEVCLQLEEPSHGHWPAVTQGHDCCT